MHEAIGGYFELADRESKHDFPIKEGVMLNTGRNALEYILLHLPDIRFVYLPFYTCEAVLEPLKRLQHIEYCFYHINEKLEINDEINLQDGEYLIANNYFGIKDDYICKLYQKYGNRLIVDNAQALFASALPDMKAYYSTRKFVGVADGGIAVGVDGKESLVYEEDNSSLHNAHLLIRKEKGAEAGFSKYQEDEHLLDNQPIKQMCRNTRDILCHIDYERVKARRKHNFLYLHQELGTSNHLQIPPIDSFACAMIYPYLISDGARLRKKLIENKIFVAKYWPNILIWSESNKLEYQLANRIIPLPIDQRYDDKDMQRILKIIRS